MIEDNRFASLVFNALLKRYKLQHHKILGPVWQYLWDASIRIYPGPVSVNVHGRRILVNNGHSYPLYARRFLHWNNPLIVLVHESAAALSRAVILVDIGASVGDTVLLLESNCSSDVRKYVCVEGDADFFRYLEANLNQPDRYELYKVMLSDSDSVMPSLVRIHAGTASAQGESTVPALSFDNLMASSGIIPDVIKIDVDGYDGKVLSGMQKTLELHKPAIIFEWDPSLCKKTDNSWKQHFDILTKFGYTRFVWFSKYGDFSHFMTVLDADAIERLAEVCLSGEHDDGWHYDIVALHGSSAVSDYRLALQEFAKHRRSWY